MPSISPQRNNHRKPWKARVTINGKERFLGYFASRHEAAFAENEFRKAKGITPRNGRYVTNPSPLGKAHWLYDDEFDMHMPCCSQAKDGGKYCNNGPLVGGQIAIGNCGQHDAAPPQHSSTATPEDIFAIDNQGDIG